MPAVSKKQRQLMAIAENDPDAVYPENRGILGMTKSQLHDYASTPEKGLPKRKNKNALRDILSGKKRIKKRAEGGKVDAGDYYLVGEMGPEIFKSNMEGRIIPYSKEKKVKMKNYKLMSLLPYKLEKRESPDYKEEDD